MIEDIRRLKQLSLDEESVSEDVVRSAKYVTTSLSLSQFTAC